jgi:subtilisin family serine protease
MPLTVLSADSAAILSSPRRAAVRSVMKSTLFCLLVAAAIATETVPWYLDRIDQAKLPLDGRVNRTGTGAGVHAYVIDSGVRRTHHDFGGRADWVGDFVAGSPASQDAADCDVPDSKDHGTHVASILGGERFGVAPGVRLHALRILPCTGTTGTDYDAAVRAVEWITAHGQRPAVVNISPARWKTADARLDQAILRSIAAGFVYVLSAGGVDDIAAYSPQRVGAALKVAGTDRTDHAGPVDYGPTLTLFAPGVAIEAAGNTGDQATFTADGDSYAAPVVAGIIALYLEQHPRATPAEVKAAVIGSATGDVVIGAGMSPNLLAHLI